MGKQMFNDNPAAISAYKAADNETLTGVHVDMSDAQGVMFIALVAKGETVAGYKLYAQQGALVGDTDMADLAGSAVSFSSNVSADVIRVLDIYNPQEQYVRPKIDVPNMTAATPVFVIAVKYQLRIEPSALNTGKSLISPSEGTP